ncbi:MAG TPA: GNAT family N-acetyltransferase [Chitinophagaceae bacterium]|jgi:GNAT superfamily N-acetyltransferase
MEPIITIHRTRYDDPAFKSLTRELDADLRARYLTEQDKFDPLNKMDESVKVVLACNGPTPIGCGALRPLEEEKTIELKRMYVQPAFRGRGISRRVMEELEQWAAEAGYHFIRLETGNKQPEAIGLYTRHGYQLIPAYGVYRHIDTSICMEKKLVTRS